MNYTQWKDAEGKYHDISNMESSYIKNCIHQLKLAIETYHLYSDVPYGKTNNPNDDEVLRRNWSIDHAIPFLKAFEAELERRSNH